MAQWVQPLDGCTCKRIRDICTPPKNEYTQTFMAALFMAEQGRNNQNTYHLMSELKIVLWPHNGILFGHKKSKVVIRVAIWMNLENIMLSEISSTQWVIYFMIPFISKSIRGKFVETRVPVLRGQDGGKEG